MPGYHPGNSYNIVTAPIDGRPISLEYLRNLVYMGGDSFFSVDKAYLDKGPTDAQRGFIFGNPSAVRSNLALLVGARNLTSTIVIISTTSYINGGLVASRVPTSYNEAAGALSDLDLLTTNYSNPVYYISVPMPRNQPDPRFDWPLITDYGLPYFYNNDPANIAAGKSIPSGNFTPETNLFVNLLTEWAYVSDKQVSGYKLSTWENQFKTYFESKYLTSSVSPQYNGVSYLTIYENLYRSAGNLIKALIDRKRSGKIDELIIGIDDINLPTFYARYPSLATKDDAGAPMKFGWPRKYLNEVKAYHGTLYNRDDVILGENGDSTAINYISGVDEIPQLIYARDLTRRTGFRTNFIVDYTQEKNPTLSKTYVGANDLLSSEATINQRLNFVTKRGYPAKVSRPFRLFVHNWDTSGAMLRNAFGTVPAAPYPLPEPAAVNFARTVFNHFSKNENVGILDLATGKVDWQLFRALGMISGYNRTQLACYSGWNTVGNAAGLGIAHAQVFGILDYYNAVRGMWSWHACLLSQHLLEDGIYNTKIREETLYRQCWLYMPPEVYTTVATNTWSRFRSNDPNPENPGGNAYVTRLLTNPAFPMRLAGNKYTWSTVYIKPNTPPTEPDLFNITGHPWRRTFECIVDLYVR